MRVQVRDGGDGVRCWNVQPIADFARSADQHEARLAAANPDLTIEPGLLICYGCEVMEYDLGVKCTAELTRTRFFVRGEIEPRPADAKASIALVTGLLTKAPDAVASAAPDPTVGAAPATTVATSSTPQPVPPAPPERRGFRLFGR